MDIQLLIFAISLGMLYFLLASGFSLIFGLMKVVNYAHASLFMWGGYLTWWFYGATDSFILGMLIAVVIVTIAGVLMEVFLIRNIKGIRENQILLTFGMIYIFDELLKITFGTRAISPTRPPFLTGNVELFGIELPIFRMLIIVAGIVVFIIVTLLLKRTKLGMTITAGTERPHMVRAVGINIRKVFTLTFALGCALAALGGGLSAFFLGLHPGLSIDQLFNMLIVVVIGGIGSFTGSFVAALLLALLEYFVGLYFPGFAMVASMLFMLVVLIVKPQGLLVKGGSLQQ
ncbi:MAG: branched-chain amino acid ABC transporter permease [Oscillospiraceae bacterium]|nr:branched-chain amino acid ABC transporter permease [Oscillospiraceae bacterium]